jgi:hypothetical protein
MRVYHHSPQADGLYIGPRPERIKPSDARDCIASSVFGILAGLGEIHTVFEAAKSQPNLTLKSWEIHKLCMKINGMWHVT